MTKTRRFFNFEFDRASAGLNERSTIATLVAMAYPDQKTAK